MKALIKFLAQVGLFREGLDYGLLRASMVLIFYIFGYAKWHAYDVPLLTPLISTGPLIFWLVPTFGPQGAVWFLGATEWTIGTLLLLGFWNKKLGLLGAIGSTGTFVCTVTILPFLAGAWEPSVGFPALTLNSGFLVKDFVLLAVSIYLMRQDALRVSPPRRDSDQGRSRDGNEVIRAARGTELESARWVGLENGRGAGCRIPAKSSVGHLGAQLPTGTRALLIPTQSKRSVEGDCHD